MRENQWNGDFASQEKLPVCCKFFCFAHNVSKNHIFYRKNDRYQFITSDLASDRPLKVSDAQKFNSIFYWLVDFSLYFLLSPTNDDVYLPFRQKFQVYDFYLRAVRRQRGNHSFDPFVGSGINKYSAIIRGFVFALRVTSGRAGKAESKRRRVDLLSPKPL